VAFVNVGTLNLWIFFFCAGLMCWRVHFTKKIFVGCGSSNVVLQMSEVLR